MFVLVTAVGVGVSFLGAGLVRVSYTVELRTNHAIAGRLGIAERTVEKHCTNIFSKLDLPARPDDHRRVLAVLRYPNA